jgi:hypothetical protein
VFLNYIVVRSIQFITLLDLALFIHDVRSKFFYKIEFF